MPGLLEQAMGQPPVTQPQQSLPGSPPGQPPPGPPPGQPAGEFDQKELDIFIANGMKMIHSEKISDGIIARVTKAKNPVAALADVVLNIVARLEQSSEAAGKKLSFTTLAYGANVLMGEVIASAEAAGMKKLDNKAKYEAMSLAVSKYLDNALKTGKMTKEELIQLGQEAETSPAGQKIKQYAESGKLPTAGTPAEKTPPGVPPTGGPPAGVPPKPVPAGRI